MHIVVLTHTCPRFPGDPVAPFMDDFCKGLIAAGNKVTLLAPYDPLFKPLAFRPVEVKLYRYIFPRRFHLLGYSRTLEGDQKLRRFVYFLSPLLFFFSFLALRRLVRQEKIDLISAHWLVPNGFVAVLVSRLYKIPLVITVPGSDVYVVKKNRFFHLMARFAVRQAKVMTSNSYEYLKQLQKDGLNLRAIQEIPYGVDILKYKNIRKKRSEVRQRYQLAEKDFVILAVGRLVEKKGFRYLIKAMPAISQKIERAKLVIVGQGSEYDYLKNLSQKLDIAEKVLFLGRINYDKLTNIYALADIYAATSVQDSQGNLESHIVALFEALAAGLPAVATNLAVNATFVQDGKNGWRVKMKDSQALATAIIKLAKSDKLAQMGGFSQEIAQKYLSYQKSGQAYSRLFKTLVRPASRE